MTSPPNASVNFSAIKANQQIAWAAGNLSIISRPLVGVAENLCEDLQLRASQKVLDVATGTGNAAIAAARRYCEVVGIDYVASLLDQARARATVEGLSIDFREGDAEAIPFPDASFDVVLSTFGVMFAPNQAQAANELVRVCRSGGKIGLTNWTPEGFFGKMGKTMAPYAPPPPGLKPPGVWGTEAGVRGLLGDEVSSVEIKKQIFFHRYHSLDHAVELTCNHFGPAVRVMQSLEQPVKERLMQDIRTMFAEDNQATDGTVLVPAEYLVVLAVRR